LRDQKAAKTTTRPLAGRGINTWGNLGNGTNVNSTYPVQVSGLSNVAGIGAGYLFSVALKSDGTVWSWGDNSTGQLGTEMLINSSNVPIRVLVITNVTKLVAGGYHSVAVQSDGSVFVWGQNVVGQAGNGTVTPMNNLPVRSNPWALSRICQVALRGNCRRREQDLGAGPASLSTP